MKDDGTEIKRVRDLRLGDVITEVRGRQAAAHFQGKDSKAEGSVRVITLAYEGQADTITVTVDLPDGKGSPQGALFQREPVEVEKRETEAKSAG